MKYDPEYFSRLSDCGALDGVFFDVPEHVYRSAPGVCQSDLKEMEISPAHYFDHITSPPKPPTDAQIIGTLTHSLILCCRQDFAVVPDDAPAKPTKSQLEAEKPSPKSIASIAWWKNFREDNPGKELIGTEESINLVAMREAIFAHPDAAEILKRPGNNEVACWKTHEPTGLLIKGRADRVTSDNSDYIVIPDLKTVPRGGAARDEFTRDIYKWGYYRQAAFYLDLFGATFFIFIVVEKEPPYAVACYPLNARSVQLGRSENERDLALVKRCSQLGHWPAYPAGLGEISVPEWALKHGLKQN